ncbi:MAG: hypothetical protein ACRCX2_16945 [Paraclostridium sp.]
MDPIVINIMDLTQGITQQDLSTPLVVSCKQNYALKLISSIDEITDAGVDTDLYKMANAVLRQRPQEMYVLGVTATGGGDASGADIIAKITELDIPHYYATSDVGSAADRKTLADFYGGRIGFYSAMADLGMSAEDAIAEAATLATESCVLVAHNGIKVAGQSVVESYAAAALIGKMAPVIEGGAPWFYQSLDGIPDGGYSKSDVAKLYKGNVNTVTTYMKRVETWGGRTTKGTYCHFKVLKDWLQVRLKEALAKVIHTDKGVFMSDDGLSDITRAMKEVLDVGKIERGTLLTYTVYTPLRASIPQNDRANGIVNGYQIKVMFTGFVEKVTINIIAEV